MIIVGDIASPSQKHNENLKQIFIKHADIFGNRSLICNFEGLINDEIDLSANTPVLFNHSSVIEALKVCNVKAVGLANNHILDLPKNFGQTIEQLQANGIAFAGAAFTKSAALKPATYKENGKDIILFNACWDFLLYHQKNPTDGVHIAEIVELQLIKAVRKHRSNYPEAAIIISLHWSFDLETLPFPMYRQFSRSLIDAGANVVAGSHSHCVQGGEKYKDGYIVYGLGNFFLPYNTFANSYLTFPDFARVQLAFEWDSDKKKARCHWFKYQNEGENHTLSHLGSDDFENSKLLADFSPYSSLSDNEYIKYFKINRRKKLLLPIYTDYNKVFVNELFTSYLKFRGRLARLLSKYGFRKWQN
jgi:poly-gamma-glutamate synthesis protein (capsule biosynthesis protein)